MQHMATKLPQITNSLVVCAFIGSDKCLPSAPCCSFYLHNIILKLKQCVIMAFLHDGEGDHN